MQWYLSSLYSTGTSLRGGGAFHKQIFCNKFIPTQEPPLQARSSSIEMNMVYLTLNFRSHQTTRSLGCFFHLLTSYYILPS